MISSDPHAPPGGPLDPFTNGFAASISSPRGVFVRLQSRPTLLGRIGGLLLIGGAIVVLASLLVVALTLAVVAIPVLGAFLLAKGAVGRMRAGSLGARGPLATDGVQRENVRVIRPDAP